MIEDPDIQKGIMAGFVSSIGGLLAGIWWYFKRRIAVVDNMDQRLHTVESRYISREELKETVTDFKKEIKEDVRQIGGRIDDIFKALPGQKK